MCSKLRRLHGLTTIILFSLTNRWALVSLMAQLLSKTCRKVRMSLWSSWLNSWLNIQNSDRKKFTWQVKVMLASICLCSRVIFSSGTKTWDTIQICKFPFKELSSSIPTLLQWFRELTCTFFQELWVFLIRHTWIRYQHLSKSANFTRLTGGTILKSYQRATKFAPISWTIFKLSVVMSSHTIRGYLTMILIQLSHHMLTTLPFQQWKI